MSGEGILPNEFRTHGADSAIDDEMIDLMVPRALTFRTEGWWLQRINSEPDCFIGAGCRLPTMSPGDEIRFVSDHVIPPALRKSARAVDLGGRS